MSEWIIIVGVGIATYLTRASFIVFADPRKFPAAMRLALSFVPAAVLAAIVVPGLVMPLGTVDVSLANPRFLAGLAAMAIAARFPNPLTVIVAGMASLWGLQALAS